jgi:membrane protease subunit (stomatin/prohibitin family)
MGILKAAVGAVHSVKEEMWREFFCCDTMSDDTILLRAEKRVGQYSANTRKDDNVLTNGSILSVADGQCVLVVKQGKVIDFCGEPGEHIFEDPEQRGLKGFFREVGRRVAFGGGDIQPTVYRVYYMNTKEITGLSFQTREPVPFRIRDKNTGLELDSGLRLSGCFSYRVSDPVKLYKDVIGNVTGRFTREDLAAHMRTSLMQGLQPALAGLSELGLRPNELPAHVPELCEALRAQMNAGWCGEHGLELASLALDSCVPTDGGLVQSVQEAEMLTDPTMAAAVLTQAVAEALPAAAANGVRTVPGMAVPTGRDRTPWVCACGQRNDSPFCRGCGAKRPETGN